MARDRFGLEGELRAGQPWESVLPYPPEVAAQVRERWLCHRGLRDRGITTVFLNFDGATIRNGLDSNASTDTTWIAFTKGDCAARESVTIPPASTAGEQTPSCSWCPAPAPGHAS